MKNFALVAFALIGYWFISNPYNWPVFSQSVTVSINELALDNVGKSRREAAAQQLARSELELIKLKVLRDSLR